MFMPGVKMCIRDRTLNVTFNNHFRVAAGADMRDVADKVKREILAVITDTGITRR